MQCKCGFNGRKCNLDQWWNNDKCWCECKKSYVCGKDYIWNPAACHVIVKMEHILQVLWMIQLLFVKKLQSHTMENEKLFQ